MLVLWATFSPIFAASPPPSLPVESISWKARSMEKPAAGLHLGPLKVDFERTTLARVLAAVGKGTIQHQGDAAGSEYWLCYTIDGSQRLWFVASAEMGSGERVTEVAAQQTKLVKGSPDCPALPSKLQPVSLQHGLWIGASDEVALQALGTPSNSKDAWRYFDYEAKVKGDCPPEGLDITNWLAYKLDNGKVVTVVAGQVTSC